MNGFSTMTAGGSGVLTEVGHRLAATIAALACLQAETAWECRAAEEYRAALEALLADARQLRAAVGDLEGDLRALWHRAAIAGAC